MLISVLAEAHLKSSFQDWRLGLACAQSLLTNSDNKYRRSLTSSHPPQVCQTAQPHGSGAVFGLAIQVRSRSGSHRPGTSLVWVCCFQGFSSHHHGRETEAAQVISLPRHCYVLTSLSSSMCMSSLVSRCPNCSGFTFALKLLGFSKTLLSW